MPLGAAVAEALQNNPEILAARRDQEAAQQRIAPAGALDDPMLEAGVVNLPVNSLDFHREDMTMKMIGLSQRLPYPGKRALRENVAAKDAEGATHNVQEAMNRITRDVKLAYFDLGFAIQSARITENNKRVLEQLLQIAEMRYTVGQASQADVLKAQTEVSKMSDELIKLARDRRSAEAELSKAMGRMPEVPAPMPLAPELWQGALKHDALRDTALASRPQLRALETTVARNENALELARKDYYPDFDVRLSYGQRDKTVTGERRDDMVSLTVAINLPVWGGTKQGPRVAEAVAMREQASRMYDAQRNEMLSQLKQRVASAEQSYQSARLYETSVLVQARLAAESSLAAYKVNRVDFLTLLESQMTVFNYEVSHASAIVNQSKALAEIEFITGKALF
jgi:outer membrane protein TolC